MQAKCTCLCLAFLSALSVEWAKRLLTTLNLRYSSPISTVFPLIPSEKNLLLLLFLQLKTSVLIPALSYVKVLRPLSLSLRLQATRTTAVRAATRTAVTRSQQALRSPALWLRLVQSCTSLRCLVSTKASSTLKALVLRFTKTRLLMLSSTLWAAQPLVLDSPLTWLVLELALTSTIAITLLTKKRLISTTWYACVVPLRARSSPSLASLTRQLRRRFAQPSILSAAQRMPRATKLKRS